jgi:hypothetical protein
MRGWEWRKAAGGYEMPADRGPQGRAFHAYDGSNLAACDSSKGLCSSCEQPGDGSHFCPDCMSIVVFGDQLTISGGVWLSVSRSSYQAGKLSNGTPADRG